MSKAPIRIGLPPNQRVLFIERQPSDKSYPWVELVGAQRITVYAPGYWLVPLSTNATRTLGEFLKLYDNGKIERITLRADDDDACVIIKPEDSNCN